MMNNMNNFAMNPMGFNPIQINNMGMIDMNVMNNMQNLNDENVLRIKNIIQPYENKIKELEEIIRQKDFEIAVLKDKLNNNNSNLFNFQNQNFINFAPTNMIIQNQNQEIYNKGQQINVFFETINESKSFICYENEMTYKLFDRIYPNSYLNYNLYKFNCKGKTLEPFLIIKENELYNGCKIKANPTKNCFFKQRNQSNIQFNIKLDENYPIKKAIKYYLLKIGQKGSYNKFKFLINDVCVNVEDKTPVKKLFPSWPDICIHVICLYK